ncbi:MAG: class I SAM-dependent methyltransferase [Verrucomicrobiota bacterium]
MTNQALHDRESEFHDKWANETSLDSIQPSLFFESATSLENAILLDLVKDFSDLKVLDVGCGLGESSVYFATRGANVTAMDLSPEMVRLTSQLAQKHHVTLESIAHAGETLPFDNNTFDLVYLANIIHHVSDRDSLLKEIKRVLKPGGLYFSWDPVAYNPVINVYRRMASEVRTPDEEPLTVKDFKRIQDYFPDASFKTTWFLTLSLFLKYYLVDRLNPNETRYWKHIMSETPKSLIWWKPLLLLDQILLQIPGLRWLTWNITVWGRKSVDS